MDLLAFWGKSNWETLSTITHDVGELLTGSHAQSLVQGNWWVLADEGRQK